MPLHYTLLTYCISSFFAKAKTSNAIGIANLPQALLKLEDARKIGKSLKKASWSARVAYLWAALQSLVVFGGLTNRWAGLIQANAFMFTVNAARDTVVLLYHERTERKTEEADELLAQQKKNDDIKPKVTPKDTSSSNEAVKEKKKTAEQQVKDLIESIRSNRAYDDLAWGIFQCALLYFNHGQAKAFGIAGFVFLFKGMERAFLDEKLTWQQRLKRFGLICFTGYMTGRLVF